MEEVANLKLNLESPNAAVYQIPELKKECKARGLSTSGNKGDLVLRLQSAMASEKPPSDDSVLDDALIDEDSMLDEDSIASGSSNEDSSNAVDLSSPTSIIPPKTVLSKSSPEKSLETLKRAASASPTKTSSQTNGSNVKTEDRSPPAKKKITINREPLPAPAVTQAESTDKAEDKHVIKISALTAEEKAKLRQAKFGDSVANNAPESKPTVSSTPVAAAIAANPFMDERLKKRAERFGDSASTASPAAATTPTATGKISLTTEEDIRIAKRKERFGASAANTEVKKDKRAERFGSVPDTSTPAVVSASTGSSVKAIPVPESDEKKKLRAARFAP